MIAAAYLEHLDQGPKLLLMALADSCDEQTRLTAPGLPKLRAWSGLGRSQTLSLVGELCHPIPDIRPRYLERVARGRVGQRATFRVFPEGVPAIPHPDEIVARYELSTAVDNSVEKGPADWTLDLGEGPISGQEGPAQTGPLHASTSVSSARRGPELGRRSVDKAPPAPSTGGFPGARANERPDPRTQPGFYRVPCPFHAGEVHPCGRCANEATKGDPVAKAAAIARARHAARGGTTPEETDHAS